ncbi:MULTISPECIES: hypothetical protein [Heyndrickxia]|uniref:hypothetical protein n=1 Tax=Heyndrickxia TaxID=2837504 RepID=UPI002DB6C574|nr:hypothetical protein [Weizmannia sp. CD-2023]MEC2223807.1 hypothetical protein [Weizmannia sp. CD-2023]
MGEISALESTHGTSFALQSAKTIAASLLERRDKNEGAVSRLFGIGKIPALESIHGSSFALKPAKMVAASLLERRDKDEGAVSRLFGGENNG